MSEEQIKGWFKYQRKKEKILGKRGRKKEQMTAKKLTETLEETRENPKQSNSIRENSDISNIGVDDTSKDIHSDNYESSSSISNFNTKEDTIKTKSKDLEIIADNTIESDVPLLKCELCEHNYKKGSKNPSQDRSLHLFNKHFKEKFQEEFGNLFIIKSLITCPYENCPYQNPTHKFLLFHYYRKHGIQKRYFDNEIAKIIQNNGQKLQLSSKVATIEENNDEMIQIDDDADADAPKEKIAKNIQVIDLDDVPAEAELTCSKAKYPCKPAWKAPSKGTLTLHMKYFHDERFESPIIPEEEELEKTRENNPNYSNLVTENSDLISNHSKMQDFEEDLGISEEIQIDDPRSINENEFENQNNVINHIEIVKHEIFVGEKNETEKRNENTRENNVTKNAAGTGNDAVVLDENKTTVEITIDEKEIYEVIIHKNSNEITLGELKKNMPISGHFRYFIQVGNIGGKDKYNQYEDESRILPLFRDNIIVKCKSL